MHDVFYLIAAAVLGTVSVVAWQLYPPGFEAMVLRDILNTKCRTEGHQRGQIAALKAVQDMQEKRILRLEIDNTRKQRVLLARGQEIEMLENVVRVAVTGLRTDCRARGMVDEHLSGLAEFRRRAQDQQDEWEQQESNLHAYFSEEVVGDRASLDLPVQPGLAGGAKAYDLTAQEAAAIEFGGSYGSVSSK